MFALHATLTHVLGQLCHHWLPLPAPADVPDADARVTPFDASEADWRALCQEGLEERRPWPWVQALRVRHAGDPAALVQAVLRHLGLVQAHGAVYLDFGHPHYPPWLRETEDPPAALTAWGVTSQLTGVARAVVGARRAAREAMILAADLGRIMAARGDVVVSGGAFGCDMAAHQGAWASDACPVPTAVVFAGGLGQIYPKTLLPFFQKLRAGGAVLLSEKLWWHQPRPYDFLVRNRIIAGMGREVVLIQAAERSGAATTVAHALQRGRDVSVWAGPSEHDVRFAGNRAFLRDGAPVFHTACEYEALLEPRDSEENGECMRWLRPYAWPFVSLGMP